MRKILLSVLAGAVLLLPQAEASVSPREQTLGRAVIMRPVLEDVREDANQAIEKDVDALVCRLTDEVEKGKDSEGRFSYQVISESEFYVSLLMETQLRDKKGKETRRVYGVLYEKLHGRRVSLEALLGFKPALKQLEELKLQNGIETMDGRRLGTEETAKLKRVPEDIAIGADDKLYLIFQPGELKPDYPEPTRLLLATP